MEKYIPLEDGTQLEVGDLILVKYIGTQRYYITRVTNTLALSKVNDRYEVKFPRVWKKFGFHSIPVEKWDTKEYKAYRKVNVND